MKLAIDEQLALKYGSYASFRSDFAPDLVETFGDNPADEVDRLLDMVAHPEINLLDLGCGAGQTLCRLAPMVKHIWGFDQEVELLTATQARAEALALANVTLINGNVAEAGDVDQLPNDTFDVVLTRRGPNINGRLLAKLTPNAVVIQELAQPTLGLFEIFGRAPFLPQAGSDPHWLLNQYKWLGLLPISIKDYFFESYFADVDKFIGYLKQSGTLFNWRMPRQPFSEAVDGAALDLYVRYNQTDKGIRLMNHRKVYFFRKTAVSHFPAYPNSQPLYVD